MRRFFLPPEECREPILRLRGDEAHHAARVLRLQPGDSVCVLDGAGQRVVCVARAVAKSEVSLDVVSRETFPPPPVLLALFCAVPKGGVFDDILEQAIELGVGAVTPLITDRGAVRYEIQQAETRRAKWRATAIESVKQCGSPWLPSIAAPATVDQALGDPVRGELAMAADLRPGGRGVSAVVSEAARRLGRVPLGVSVWIGPEGDFSPRELDLMRDAGLVSVTLGSRVLRCATAALSALAIVSESLRGHLRADQGL
ncbi:MAG: 16S rRNA (uracil(1498)-N(3))-methyltransferase [Verrucomicrobia bacterium]|nr:16S rRNA (uracil(1498)-N(3))-methyltransferase [Verrucomicrobiota bacterium]MBI3867749.1 16S rRNA (uracil(1498)-N(3))-methyltransferase [Verrucomicrobiota bacterium]